ncbi:PP2C family protein-serine/threonine phosphatase [Pantoea ananatis]|jgi:protein phosphatase|uniref:PP2C family protein-serine/threonine phosphatase n=1 Tax=Pantoea ananas TaxID=553 RepID=UPI001903AFD7|nr:protein phosphatase 2C domain-containing protein [Pantoea ananatis]
MNKIIEMSCFSSKQHEKEENEDFYLPPTFDNNFNLVFAVADGVGNSEHSILASHAAIQGVKRVLKGGVFSIEEAFHSAKKEIDKLNITTATTLTIIHVKDEELLIGHAGDCRVYYCEKNKLKQLTTDQTRYQELLDSGEHKLRNLKNHKERLSSILINALSNTTDLSFELLSVPINELRFNGFFQVFAMSDGAYKHWDVRPKFSEKTMNSPSAFASSLRKRIEKNIVDDYTFIGVKLT